MKKSNLRSRFSLIIIALLITLFTACNSNTYNIEDNKNITEQTEKIVEEDNTRNSDKVDKIVEENNSKEKDNTRNSDKADKIIENKNLTIETIEINPKISLESEGKLINNYYYSPDGNNYFIEENRKSFETELLYSFFSYRLYFNNKKEIFGRDWYLRGERNLSPTPVIWLNNHEVIFVGGAKGNVTLNKLDINTTTNEINLPKNENWKPRNSFGNNLNKKENKIAFIFSSYSSANIYIYIYDIENGTWKKVTNYLSIRKEETNLNIAYGLNSNIYFDVVESELDSNYLIRKENFTIKKYNINTSDVTDYKENARLLNISPDNRYLVFMDMTNNKTIIQDLVENRKIEVPKAVEIVWNQSSKEFSYIAMDDNSYLMINKIDEDVLKQRKVYIGNLQEKDYQVINLQYINDKILFDYVKYTKDVEKRIDNVKTFSINTSLIE